MTLFYLCIIMFVVCDWLCVGFRVGLFFFILLSVTVSLYVAIVIITCISGASVPYPS